MRPPLLGVVLAGALATAAAAAAQEGVAVNAPGAPGDQGSYLSRSFDGPESERSDRHQRYLMRLRSLSEWMQKLKVEDGGQLSAEHAAMVERQRDKLIRIYGKG